MAKKKNQATMLRTFLLITAIFAVSALAMAGLLTYYAKAVGTVKVEQAVTLASYDSDGRKISEIDHTGTINFYNEGYAGTILYNGIDTRGTDETGDDVEIAYFEVYNYAGTDSADVIIALVDENGDVLSSLPEEVADLKFLAYDETSCTSTEIGSGVSGQIARQVTINPKSGLKFCIAVKYKINTEPGTYTLRVRVLPTTS
jgi:hypothetical protein